MPANTHTHMYMYIYIYMYIIYIHISIHTHILLHIHNRTSNQCTCTHWLHIAAWLLCLLRAVLGSFCQALLVAMSFLSLGPAVFATQTTFGLLFGWLGVSKDLLLLMDKNPANNSVVYPMVYRVWYISGGAEFWSINSLVIYTHIINRLFPSSTPKESPIENVFFKIYTSAWGGAGSVLHLCHRHVKETFWTFGRVQVSSFAVLSKEFSKNSTDWVWRVWIVWDHIFWHLFLICNWNPKNCQIPTTNHHCHQISSNPLGFFQVLVHVILFLDKCRL